MTENFSNPNTWSEGTGPAEPVFDPAPTVGGTGGSSAEPSTTSVAGDEAAEVAGQAADSAKHVVDVARDEAGDVVAEAASEIKDLVEQTRTELAEQASVQQQRVAAGLRSISEELESMAAGAEGRGPASDMVRQAAHRSSSVATWLEARDPGSVVDEVKSFARQRPVAFLAIAAGAGILAGRLTRGLGGGAPASEPSPGQSPKAQPVVPPQPRIELVGYGTAAEGSGIYDGPADSGVGESLPTIPASAPFVEEVPVVDPFEGGGSR